MTICHMKKFPHYNLSCGEISPHGRFFLHKHVGGVGDEYQVWSVGPSLTSSDFHPVGVAKHTSKAIVTSFKLICWSRLTASLPIWTWCLLLV